MDENWIQKKLNDATAQGLARQARVHAQTGGVIMHAEKRVLNFSGNDYLNLSKHPHVIERARSALETYGSGATASRFCLLYTSPSPRDRTRSRMPSSA